MPDLTIPITDDTHARLLLAVAQYNQDHGTSLDLTEYVQLHLRQLAVQRDLLLKVEQLKQQTQDDLAAAVAAEETRLLTDADTPKPR